MHYWMRNEVGFMKKACLLLVGLIEITTEVIGGRPPLWASGQNSWLQIQGSSFDSRRYQIFWEVVGLERGPLSLVSTIEELLDTKRSGSGLENREHILSDPPRWPRDTVYHQTLALTSSTSGCQSVGIVRSQTQATEFSLVIGAWLSF
jgi:hypothetical protein